MDIKNGIKKYTPNSLLNNLIDVVGFEYESTAYQNLAGKKFQALFVEDDPIAVPFVSNSSVKARFYQVGLSLHKAQTATIVR